MGAKLPSAMAKLVETVTGDFADARAEIKRQALAAAARGEQLTDLELHLPLSYAEAGEQYLAALDEADQYARAAQLLTMKAAWLYDRGRPCGAEANSAKYLAAEAGFEACDAALQTLGGFGYSREFHVERLWREVRLYRLAPITQEMALNYLSQHVLGLPKS